MWTTLNQHLERWRGILITAPSIAGVLLVLRLTGALQFMELVALDQMFRLRPTAPADPRIILVTIDEFDIKRLGQWPMSDATLARTLSLISQQQPRVIGLDLFRDLPVEPGHQELAQVFTSTPNLFGVEKVIKTAQGEQIQAPLLLKQRDQVTASDLVLDPDNRIRRSLLYLRTPDNQSIFTLGAKLAFAYLDQDGITRQPITPDQMTFRLGRATFTPLTPNAGGYAGIDAGGYQILANFPRFQSGFHTVSLTDLLQGDVPPDLMRDRIVLVGLTAASIEDKFFTAYTTDTLAAPAGLEVHALLASQVLSAALEGGSLLNVWPEPLEWLWIIGWTVAGSTIGWTSPSPRQTIMRVVLSGGALLGIAYGLFLAGWWIIIVPPLLALVSAAIASNTYLLWNNLNDYARTLEQKVDERTVTLQQEIVERQQAELDLLESEARFRQLAEAAVEAVVVMEQDHVLDVNQAFTQMFGYSLADTRGMPVDHLVVANDRELFVQVLQLQGEGFQEINCLHSDGTTFPAEIRLKVATYGERVVKIASIYNISDRKKAEAASILEERNRMAREIHDTLAQSFTGILLQVGAATQVLADDLDATQMHLKMIDQLARTGLAEARRSVTALRPQLLEDGNLPSALYSLVTQMKATIDAKLIYAVRGNIYPLPSDVENNLLRIGQEALTNAIKYADASEIRIELVYENAQCCLYIKDDGRGFEVGNLPAIGGFGLLGMSERAERMGAQLMIQSQPSQGTEIVVTVNRE
ncbi:MAG TPA: CHASE2 domain-containing protein [Chroococcidiopsis sp.]